MLTYTPQTGRYVQFTCVTCGYEVRDYQRWHEPVYSYERTPMLLGLPEEFWWCLAAVLLVVLFMLAMSKAGY